MKFEHWCISRVDWSIWYRNLHECVGIIVRKTALRSGIRKTIPALCVKQKNSKDSKIQATIGCILRIYAKLFHDFKISQSMRKWSVDISYYRWTLIEFNIYANQCAQQLQNTYELLWKGQPTGRRIQEPNQNTDHASQGGTKQLCDCGTKQRCCVFVSSFSFVFTRRHNKYKRSIFVAFIDGDQTIISSTIF